MVQYRWRGSKTRNRWLQSTHEGPENILTNELSYSRKLMGARRVELVLIVINIKEPAREQPIQQLNWG
jgi:hypothetical protein